ncbi:MAG: hypothetical protein FJY17_00535 [Bacteroidetes bacterium]|nr:hypothetical protein [Bacteroidota bacterium]
MAKLLDRIKSSIAKEGFTVGSNAARGWLRNKVRQLSPSPKTLMDDKNRIKSNSTIGKMYFYFYDPKTKDDLQYYDMFPLVIPIEEYKDGFLGLNLHYIHPKQRIILLDKLSETASNKNFDSKTKLRLNYGYLASASRAFEATPCIKRYLFSHIQSRFLEISADEWDIAVLLPVESFVGASTSKVYADSRKKF